jgi:hypothetical protein
VAVAASGANMNGKYNENMTQPIACSTPHPIDFDNDDTVRAPLAEVAADNLKEEEDDDLDEIGIDGDTTGFVVDDDDDVSKAMSLVSLSDNSESLPD